MDHLLSAEESAHHSSLAELLGKTWPEEAAVWERSQELPEHVVRWCAEQGLLGAALPRSAGGGGWSAIETGLMYEALGRISASLGSLVNVHGMAAQTVLKWGTEQQRAGVGAQLAAGRRIAAICMTEQHAGSDLAAIKTSVTEQRGKLILNGTKVFITFGGRADVFLVFAQHEGHSTACLVDRENPGLSTRPMGETLGLRAASLARVELRDCVIDRDAVVGREGFALPVLIPLALEHGRHAVAWMATGMLQASFDACASHAGERQAFGRTLVEHGQVQTLLVRMATDLEAAKHLSVAASRALDAGDPAATERVLMAKYFACRAAEGHTAQAVQLLGSRGVLEDGSLARHYRDSKVLNILEGTTQIIERLLAPGLAHAASRRR